MISRRPWPRRDFFYLPDPASLSVSTIGGRNVKDVTGYRLASLFCGSEETLGIITEATLRVAPLPRPIEPSWSSRMGKAPNLLVSEQALGFALE